MHRVYTLILELSNSSCLRNLLLLDNFSRETCRLIDECPSENNFPISILL